MAKTGGIKIDGIDEALKHLQAIGDVWGEDQVYESLLVGARLLRDRAKANVRRTPGELSYRSKSRYYRHLQDGIFATRGKQTWQRGQGSGGPTVIAGVDKKKNPHSHLVEFGHGGPSPAPPHPYMRPAVDASKNDIERLVADMVKRTLENAVKDF